MSHDDFPAEQQDVPAHRTQPLIQPDSSSVPALYTGKKESTSGTSNFKIEQIFVFVLFIVLLILFSSNPIVFSSLTGLLTLLTIGALENVSNKIIEYIGIPFNWIIQPFAWLFHGLFASVKGLRSHRSFITNTIIAIILIVTLAMTTLNPLLTSTVGHINDYLCLQQTALPWTACNPGIGTEQLSSGVTIGIVQKGNGAFFDHSGLNGPEWEVERLIVHENQNACQPQKPHITLAVVTILSRTVEDPSADATIGIEDLQGAYLAQHNFNSQQPTMLLCLDIANLGTSDTAVSTSSNNPNAALPLVIHQLEQLERSDPTFHGIMGFPFSQQASAAMTEIAASAQLKSIPVISPSASADTLSNQQNFYRMVSPDQNQSQLLAQIFCNDLIKHNPGSIVIFDDNHDKYSLSLEKSFTYAKNVNCLSQRPIKNYTTGNPTSINNAVQEALSDPTVKYIFFPGYNSDLDALQLAIHTYAQDKAKNITIIGGDGLYDPDGTASHYNYSSVYSTIFASPLNPKNEDIDVSASITTFISAYNQAGFKKPYLVGPINGYNLFWSHTILSYDATEAFIKSLKGMNPNNFSQNDFNSTLSTIQFPGVSGEVDLSGDSDPQNNSSNRNTGEIYMTCVDQSHIVHIIAKYISNNVTNSIALSSPSANTNTSICIPK